MAAGDDEIWHFARMQKTAGQSFLDHLAEHFPEEDICRYHFEWQLNADPDPARWKLYLGHISPGALLEYFPRTNLILLLRDPVERLLSGFYFWQEQAAPNAPTSRFFTEIQSMTIEDYLTHDDPMFANAIWDCQARMLAGGRFGVTNHTRTCIVGPDMDDDLIVEAAKRTIDRARLVGTVERFDESVALMAKLFSNPPPEKVRFSNRTAKRNKLADLPAKTVDLLRERTQLDQVVYDYAAERLERDLVEAE